MEVDGPLEGFALGPDVQLGNLQRTHSFTYAFILQRKLTEIMLYREKFLKKGRRKGIWP